MAKEITAKCLDDLDALRRWLAVLAAPGASNLWIAKFPTKDDERDIGAWESLAHGLAQRTGIEVP